MLLNDNRPFLLGELATSDIEQERENEAAVISGPQQPATGVKSERQNTANKSACSTLNMCTAPA